MEFEIGESEGRKAYKNGENPFRNQVQEPDSETGGFEIQIDGGEALDVAIKSIISGIATGIVVNRFLE